MDKRFEYLIRFERILLEKCLFQRSILLYSIYCYYILLIDRYIMCSKYKRNIRYCYYYKFYRNKHKADIKTD